MNDILKFLLYLLVMAGVTYLLRMVSLVAIRHKIENRFILSFLYYVPYTVLTVMVVPAVFSATSSLISAAIAFAVMLVLAYLEQGLIKVALGGCATVLVIELIMLLMQL